MAAINVEYFLSSIRDRPILWDKTTSGAKDRNQIRMAWAEVFEEVDPAFEVMDDKEKEIFGRAVMKKWINIRDCFQRNEKLQKRYKPGRGKQPPKPYIYGEQLQFLKKARSSNYTAVEELEDSDDGTEHSYSKANMFVEVVPSLTKCAKVRMKRKPSVEDAPKPPPFDRHTAFFSGIIPSLESFDDDEVVEFQLKVMQVLSEMKKVKKTSANSDNLPSTSSVLKIEKLSAKHR